MPTIKKHDCWFIDDKCIFCERLKRDGEWAKMSYCRVMWAEERLTGYVCPVICGYCRECRV
jgi:hypothetical protein